MRHVLPYCVLLSMPFGAAAMTDAELARIAEQRLLGDRTGACVAVAVVEAESVARAYVCADPKQLPRIGPDSAFEIGSVSKTMTAALLADLILQGKAALDDPLDAYLPQGVSAPAFQGRQILLKHIVTHTSGLPVTPDFSTAKSMDDPYAQVDEASIWKTLSSATLSRAPGSQFEYSNYAMMLLSAVIARRAGSDFETLMRARLFVPTGMQGAFINQQPAGVRLAQGHTPNGRTAAAWTFQTAVSGVGGVKATLDDMVRYLQAQLGTAEAAITPALRLSQQPVETESPVPMAMNWMLVPLDDRRVYVHEGGTGGFSAFTAFDPHTRRGVAVLSDTALTSIGGLGSLGNHLLDARLPLGKARTLATPDPALLASIAGDYAMLPGLDMRLTVEGGRLFAQATGQARYEMGYDSAGDFFPLAFDAVLRPSPRSDGGYLLVFLQSGAAYPLRRLDASPVSHEPAPTLTPAQLAEYTGTYPLVPGLLLKVSVQNGALMAQATGQGAFVLDAKGRDRFSADAFGIEITFIRDAQGRVASLDLRQSGQTLRGPRE